MNIELRYILILILLFVNVTCHQYNNVFGELNLQDHNQSAQISLNPSSQPRFEPSSQPNLPTPIPSLQPTSLEEYSFISF